MAMLVYLRGMRMVRYGMVELLETNSQIAFERQGRLYCLYTTDKNNAAGEAAFYFT